MVYKENKMEEFYNNTKDIRFTYEPYKSDLEKALTSDDAFNYLQYQTKIPYFTFPLPDINYDKVVKECLELLKKYKNNFHYTHIPNSVNQKNWKIYFIYKNLNSNERDFSRHNRTEEEVFTFLYKNEFTELEKLVKKYNYVNNPVFLSVLMPGAVIPSHQDIVKNNKAMTKARLPISYPKNCTMLLDGVGSLDYYNNELVFFNHRLTHGVYNFSNEPKVDLSISGYITNKDDFEEYNFAIKHKIEGILNEL